MVTIPEGVEQLEVWRTEHPAMRTTGLPELDEATGGFQLGQCWMVVGTPGQGRSALASQWAWLLASEHGLTTHLVSKKEPVTRVTARIAASVAKVPLSHLWHRGMSDHDREKMLLVGPRLEGAPLSIVDSCSLSIADVDMGELPACQVLVVDDAQYAGGMFPKRVAALAARGHLVLLTLPRDRVASSTGVDPDWAGVADYVVDIERPDLLDRTSLRPGEADLHLLRNRWGSTRSVVAAFQGHYSRFVDMTTN